MPSPTAPRLRSNRKRLATLAAAAALAFAACSKHEDRSPATGARGDEVFFADGSGDAKGALEAASASAVDAEPSRAGMVAQAPVDRRKIIRTGQVSVLVEGYDASRAQIDALVAAAGGFIDSTRVEHREGQVSSAVLVLRIPSSAFGELVPALRKLGEVQSETTDASDVTAEYVDISARLGSARALEKRLLELAATRTASVAEILEVERELARIRSEIEQHQGMIKLWDDLVALSTLTVVLSTRQPEIPAPPPPAEPDLGDKVSSSFHDSVSALSNLAERAVMALVALLPWMVILIPGGVLGRRWWRRRVAALPPMIVHLAPPPPPPPMPMPMPPPPAAES